VSMLFGGSRLIPRLGKRAVTSLGIGVMVFVFLGLAGSALSGAASSLPLLITLLGAGAGLFTVGGVALMMDMTTARQTGLFVGLWTLVQALAKGPTAIAGGLLQSTLLTLGSSVPAAYAGVFVFEAFGLAFSILMLHRVAVDRLGDAYDVEPAVIEAMST